jgi:hypothetical protein
VLLFDPTVPLSFDKDGERVCGNNTGVVAVTAGVVDGGVAVGTVVDGGDDDDDDGMDVVGSILSHLAIRMEHSATSSHPGIGDAPTSHLQTLVIDPGRGGPHVPVNICPSTVLVKIHVPSHHSWLRLFAFGGTWCQPAEALHVHENVTCELDATRGVPLPPQTGNTGHRLAPTLMRSVV